MKRADIGIAMGSGSDVAKNAADIFYSQYVDCKKLIGPVIESLTEGKSATVRLQVIYTCSRWPTT